MPCGCLRRRVGALTPLCVVACCAPCCTSSLPQADRLPRRQVPTVGTWPAPLVIPEEVDELPVSEVPRGFICPITQVCARVAGWLGAKGPGLLQACNAERGHHAAGGAQHWMQVPHLIRLHVQFDRHCSLGARHACLQCKPRNLGSGFLPAVPVCSAQAIMRQPALLLHDRTINPSTYDKESITQWLAEHRLVGFGRARVQLLNCARALVVECAGTGTCVGQLAAPGSCAWHLRVFVSAALLAHLSAAPPSPGHVSALLCRRNWHF